MFNDDSKNGWNIDDNGNENEEIPEWADEKISSDSVDNDDTSFLMLRMGSHFLSIIQPKLEHFFKQNVSAFFHSGTNLGSSTHSLRQYDIYQEYTEIFETGMKAFLEEYSKKEIVDALKRANEKLDQGRESMGTIMLDLVSALSSFEGTVYFMTLEDVILTVILLCCIASKSADFCAMMEEEASDEGKDDGPSNSAQKQCKDEK